VRASEIIAFKQVGAAFARAQEITLLATSHFLLFSAGKPYDWEPASASLGDGAAPQHSRCQRAWNPKGGRIRSVATWPRAVNSKPIEMGRRISIESQKTDRWSASNDGDPRALGVRLPECFYTEDLFGAFRPQRDEHDLVVIMFDISFSAALSFSRRSASNGHSNTEYWSR